MLVLKPIFNAFHVPLTTLHTIRRTFKEKRTTRSIDTSLHEFYLRGLGFGFAFDQMLPVDFILRALTSTRQLHGECIPRRMRTAVPM